MNLEAMSKDELIEYIRNLEATIASNAVASVSFNPIEKLQSSEILKRRFDLSQKKNPAFSLRSFAKKAGISPGRLSEILNGQYLISIGMAEKIIENVEFEPAERDEFLKAVQIENKNLEELREFHKKRSEKSNVLSKTEVRRLDQEEEVELLDHWTYYGLTAALEIKACDGSVQFLAKAVGLDEAETQKRLETLVRLKVATVNDGKYSLVPASHFNEAPSTSPQASRIAAAKCSTSAFEYLTEHHRKVVAREKETAEPKQPSKEETYFFINALDTAQIGNEPRFIVQTAYDALKELSKKGQPDTVYMVNFSMVKVRKHSEDL